ncbi:MAG: DUF192 domain-containing protein [Candidatus Natronoplasma sp.]
MTARLPEHVKVKSAKSTFRKAVGLMFKRKVDYVLLMDFGKLSDNITLHSLFVFFYFHCIFLDDEKVIVDIEKEIPPFTFGITSKKPARYVLEVPKDVVDIDDFSVGEKLEV